MDSPQDKRSFSILRYLTENKRCRQCSNMVQWVRHIQPAYWIVVLVIVIILYVIFVPPDFWMGIASTFQSHTPLIAMLLFFCFLAVSLVWSAGQRIDAAIFFFFNKRGQRPQWLDRTMRIITEFGNSMVTVGVSVLFYINVSHTVAYSFIFSSLVLWLIVELMKALFFRQRPFTRLKNVRVVGIKASGKSFPSGHTSQAFFTSTLLFQYFDGGIPISILFYSLAVLVGITRMYMGMHYPRDVIAGALLGTFWGIIGMTVNSHLLELVGIV